MTDPIFEETADRPLVRIIDDEPAVCEAISDLLASVGIATVSYTSARQFLEVDAKQRPGCVVLDVRMPNLGGLDLQVEMQACSITLPIVFVTGHGDIPMSVRAMKAGAIDFLPKPFNDQALIDAVNAANERDATQRSRFARTADLKERLTLLNTGEQEVMTLTAQGLKIRDIAARLGVSEITVKVRRARVMHKMGVTSVAELARLHDAAKDSTGE
ncbi:MAG: response regulator [Pseudomonadota bacterium]